MQRYDVYYYSIVCRQYTGRGAETKEVKFGRPVRSSSGGETSRLSPLLSGGSWHHLCLRLRIRMGTWGRIARALVPLLPPASRAPLLQLPRDTALPLRICSSSVPAGGRGKYAEC
jgi:hypothetical protein